MLRASRTLPVVSCFLLCLSVLPLHAEPVAGFDLHWERSGPLFRGVPANLEVIALDDAGQPLRDYAGPVRIEGLEIPEGAAGDGLFFTEGVLELHGVMVTSSTVTLSSGRASSSFTKPLLPGWLTLLPPILAILLAIATRQVLLSLFCGIWAGVFLLEGFRPLTSFLRSTDTHCVGALSDSGHASIILFSLSLAGMVGVITRSGGVRGVVQVVSRLARGARSGQLATWVLGVLIFFDDYANLLIVGNTMRPFTDRNRISREKLSFIVDATAAPVATIGIISTWTAYQLGVIGDVLPQVGVETDKPYVYFLRSIPASFYSFLMLLVVFLCGLTLRDFGPMRKAEARCRSTGRVLRDGAEPLIDPALDRLGDSEGVVPRWYNAVVPILCVVGFTLAGLYATGLEALPAAEQASAGLQRIIGESDAYRALLWAAMGSSIVAGGMALMQGYRLGEILTSWVSGARSLVLAAMILVLAWAISGVCRELETGAYVAGVTSHVLSPRFLPMLAFLTAGLIAFATGTSYGTMGILIPILLPIVYQLSAASGVDPSLADRLGVGCLAAILGGAVFGDHCSPISDTTVLSSMAAGADHIDHVRTQLPYALLVAACSLPCYLLLGWGVSALVILPLGLVLTTAVFLWIAR